MVDLFIPKTSFEVINKIIIAYYLSQSEDGVTIKEVVYNTGYVESQISKSNKFLIELKVLVKENNKFKLTIDGFNYAEHLRNNQKDESNSILFDLIREYPGIKLVTNFVEVHSSVSLDELVKRIEEVSNSDTNIADHRTGINCLIELLKESGVLKQKDNQIKIGERLT